MDQDWDAIVVGSGLGGLTTAAYLATNGKRVLVLEARAVIGGAAQTFRRNRVFEFECGTHYVGDCEPDGVIPTVLRGIGLDGEITFNNMDHDEFDHLIAPGFDLRVPRGWDRFEQRLTEAYPKDAKGIRGVLRTLHAFAEVLEVLGAPPTPKPRDLFRLEVVRALLRAARTLVVNPRELVRRPRALAALPGAGLRLQKLFDLHGLSEAARAAIGYICAFVLLPPAKVATPIYAYALNHYIKSGGWYVHGGAGKVPHTLARVVRSHGGEVRLRTRVEKILVADGRVRGVRVESGETISAPIVVSNADIRTLYGALVDPEHLDPGEVERVQRAGLTPPLFSVYLGVDIDLRQHLRAKHFFLLDNLDIQAGIDSFAGDGENFVPDKASVWFTSSTVKDEVRPGTEGYSSIELTTATPQSYTFWGLDGGVLDGIDYHRHPAYLARKREIEDALVRKALEAFPFLEGHIVWQESSTMLSHEDYTLTRLGAWAGLDFTLKNMMFRPGPRTEVGGLFITGAGSNCGGAMIGTLRGGVETASAILGRNLWKQVRGGAVFGNGLCDKGFATNPATRPGFHALRVSEVERHTADSVVIEFDVPTDLRDTFAFRPGQHLTIRGESEGEVARRSYSICEPTTTARLRVAVKHLPGGLFSTHALEQLRVGDLLEVAPPRGTFTTNLAEPRSLAAIAAGSGITPIMSIFATALEANENSTATLLYGNRTRASIMFRAELDALRARFPDRFRVEYYLSRETADGFHSGRIDAAALDHHLGNGLSPTGVDEWFLCGPTELIDTATAALSTHDVDESRIRSEVFDTESAGARIVVATDRSSSIELTANGTVARYTMSQGEPILDAAMQARDDLPFSCLSGSCGSCRAKVLGGEVEVDDSSHIALLDDEIRDGYILTCVSYPRSDIVVVDFDA